MSPRWFVPHRGRQLAGTEERAAACHPVLAVGDCSKTDRYRGRTSRPRRTRRGSRSAADRPAEAANPGRAGQTQAGHGRPVAPAPARSSAARHPVKWDLNRRRGIVLTPVPTVTGATASPFAGSTARYVDRRQHAPATAPAGTPLAICPRRSTASATALASSTSRLPWARSSARLVTAADAGQQQPDAHLQCTGERSELAAEAVGPGRFGPNHADGRGHGPNDVHRPDQPHPPRRPAAAAIPASRPGCGPATGRRRHHRRGRRLRRRCGRPACRTVAGRTVSTASNVHAAPIPKQNARNPVNSVGVGRPAVQVRRESQPERIRPGEVSRQPGLLPDLVEQ